MRGGARDVRTGKVRGRWAGFLLLALATACGPKHPGDLGPGGELCYRFVENEAAAELRLPWGFALSGDSVPGMAEPGGRRAAATLDGEGARADVPFGAWRPLEGDSVQVGPVVTGSLQLRLAVSDSLLVGQARPIGDVTRPGATRAPVEGVAAEAVSCPAPPSPAGGP